MVSDAAHDRITGGAVLAASDQQDAAVYAVVGAAGERHGARPAAVPGGIAAHLREGDPRRGRAGGRVSG